MKKLLDKTETDIEEIRKDPENANWNSLTWFYCEYDDFIEEFQEYINLVVFMNILNKD